MHLPRATWACAQAIFTSGCPARANSTNDAKDKSDVTGAALSVSREGDGKPFSFKVNGAGLADVGTTVVDPAGFCARMIRDGEAPPMAVSPGDEILICSLCVEQYSMDLH